VDSTDLTIEQVVEQMLGHVLRKKHQLSA
jgi:hypothetical protein